MRLYFFESGRLRCDKSSVTQGRDIGKMIEIPIPFYLIQHPRGNLLYDTGLPLELTVDPKKHWGAAANAYQPIMKPEQYCTRQLEQMGIIPEDIKYIIMSHLHNDHTGAMKDFPNAKILVQRAELQWAYTCDFYQKLAYVRADFDHPKMKYHLLEGWREDPFDVFGDGLIKTWFTPGHTPGLQALSVALPNSGTFLLTSDAAYTNEILTRNILPGVGWNSEETVSSIRKIRHMRDAYCMKVVPGHDPDAWENYKKAPEYYD